MSKEINWFNWIIAGMGEFWAIYLMFTTPTNPSIKYLLTVGILMIVSVVLLGTGVRKS